MMKWYKYRTLHSYGPRPWCYVEKNEDEIKDYLQSVADDHNWSDKWRGIDWEEIECPPREILDKRMKAAYEKLRDLAGLRLLTQLKIERYQKLYRDAPNEQDSTN